MLSTIFGRDEKKPRRTGLELKVSHSAHLRIQEAVGSFMTARTERMNNPELVREFNSIQAWQARRLMIQYDHLFNNPSTSHVAQFLLQEVYSGDQLALISQEILKTAQKIQRLIPADMLDTAACTVEANVLTVKLDELIAQRSINFGGVVEGSTVYCAALRSAELIAGRREQLQKYQKLAQSVEVYLSGRAIHFGLKMSVGIAKKAQVSNLHKFLSKACSLLQSPKSLSVIVDDVTSQELALLEAIEAGQNPFVFMDVRLPKYYDDKTFPFTQEIQERFFS